MFVGVNVIFYWRLGVQRQSFQYLIYSSTSHKRSGLLEIHTHKEFPNHPYPAPMLILFPLMITFPMFVGRLRNFVTHTAINFGMWPTTFMFILTSFMVSTRLHCWCTTVTFIDNSNNLVQMNLLPEIQRAFYCAKFIKCSVAHWWSFLCSWLVLAL